MTNQSNVCACGTCVGAQCTCGCQNPAPVPAASCQCGEGCQCHCQPGLEAVAGATANPSTAGSSAEVGAIGVSE